MDKPKLLFIDDELEKEKALARILEKKFQVTTCTNVAEAKAELDKNEYSVAIIDMNLPKEKGGSLEDEAGLEICRYIRDRFIKTRGIVLTGYGGILNYRKALEAGIYDYLTKGDFQPEDVVRIALDAAGDYNYLTIKYDDEILRIFEYLCKSIKSDKRTVISKGLEILRWAVESAGEGYNQILARKGNEAKIFTGKL